MKIILNLAVFAGLAACATLGAEPANKKCPVTGKDVDPEVTAQHTVVVGFCCGKCPAKFKENPTGEKFAASIAEATGKPVNSVCPVSGKDIDADETVVHEGQTVAFCCGKCVKKYNEDPKAVAAKVKADAPGNEKCPVSGKDVDPDATVVHTVTVAFCCEKCQGKFKKDPAAVLSKKE